MARAMWMVFGLVGTGCATVQASPTVPELGAVEWSRGIDAAKKRAAASSKPVLVLFDEIPGCSTVVGFGTGPLSNPLLAEAIETLYEPVLVYNNRPEDDAVCASFDEPRWNNPVLRVLDADGADRAPRFAGPYTEAALARYLVDGLPEAPRWLSDVAAELEGLQRAESATYSMACFWSGEANLARADGVLAARTGWQGGREVVEVTYDPARLPRTELDAHAARLGYPAMTEGTLRPTPGDDHHALKRTIWTSVPMTPAQTTRVNAHLAAGKDPAPLLSPRQRRQR